LLPLAALVAVKTVGEIPGLLISYIPLAVAAIWLGAGRPETARHARAGHV
jgi:hypothetical protein